MTQPSNSRRRRRLLRWLLVAALAPLVLAGTSPLWFPWLVPPVARLLGAEVGPCQRLGLSSVRFSSIRANLGTVAFEAATVELPQPLHWLRSVARPASESAPGSEPIVTIRDWTLRFLPDTNAPAAQSEPTIRSVAEALDQAEAVLPSLAWLGGAALVENGGIQVAGRDIGIPTLRFGALGLEAVVTDTGRVASLAVYHPGAGVFQARIDSQPWEIGAEFTARKEGTAWNLDGTVSQRGERWTLQARTEPGSWIPAKAQLQSASWMVPLPDNLKGSVRVDASADWDNGRGVFTFRASGDLAAPGDPALRPIAAEITGRFTTGTLELVTLQGDWGFLRARLSGPVIVDIREPRRVSKIRIDVDASLDVVPAWQASGNLTAVLESEESRWENLGKALRFSLAGRALAARNIGIDELQAHGRLDWPLLHLDKLEAAAPENTRLAATGRFDFATPELRDATWTFEGRPPLTENAIPSPWPELTAQGTAAGPLTNLLHTGSLKSRTDINLASLPPFSASARWRLRGFNVEEIEANASHGDAGVQVRGEAAYIPAPNPTVQGRISMLEVRTADRRDLTLSQPATFQVGRTANPEAGTGTSQGLLVQIQNGEFEGAAGQGALSLDVLWPNRGQFQATLTEFTPAFLGAWLTNMPPTLREARVHQLAVDGSWSEGPVRARATVDLDAPLPAVGPLRLEGSAEATSDGIRLSEWTLTREGKPGPTFDARLPLRATPVAGKPGWRVEAAGPIQGALVVADGHWPWSWLAGKLDAEITQPEARINLGGTWAEPEVRLAWNIETAQIKVPGTNTVSPPVIVGPISARAHASTNAIVLEAFTVVLEGQRLRAEGRVPWKTPPDENSTVWNQRWTPDLDAASGFIEIPKADLAVLAKPLGEYLQPGGILRGRVDRRDAAWNGWLEITNVTTRPIAQLGSVRDVHLRVLLEDEQLRLVTGQALLGGQPVTLAGVWTLPGHPQPDAHLSLAATNLVLVRTPELLLRADLDVALTRTNPLAPPLIGGTVTLHDSLVTMDVRQMVSVDLERPRQRPPFFSVDVPAVADWGLHLKIQGDSFARIVSPMLNATTSADLGLRGTLGQPRLVGQATVDQGRLAFPFGQLKVQQFQVLFTESDPYRPSLEGHAEGLSFGYTVRLELDGTLADPEVRITSLPPMTTAEALQMLMAGSLPRNEYSYSTTGKAQNLGTYLAGDLLTQITGDAMEEPRLSIRSAERVSANGSLTYSVEYRISDRWSAIAEYDRWNQIGAGARWRVLEK
ncbi:MAG: translocation/assembly module TamB domain-containing protein [Limisphaerales bacterium]